MKFWPTPIPGALIVEIEAIQDERGFFARTVCREEFARHGANANFVQQSISNNMRRGIVRGLHWQASPHEEEKLVRVTQGAVFDVIVDVRKASPSYGQWFGIELTMENHRALYIPKGVAHGFQTLSDSTEVLYEMTVPYSPDSARGVRWDDSTIGISWPNPAGAILSERDRLLPNLGAT